MDDDHPLASLPIGKHGQRRNSGLAPQSEPTGTDDERAALQVDMKRSMSKWAIGRHIHQRTISKDPSDLKEST
jgi:hypothetical protein